MATLTSTLIMRMIDGISGPARQAAAAINGLKNSARGTASGGSGMAAQAKQMRDAAAEYKRTISELKSTMVQRGATLFAFGAAFKPAIDAAREFESVMTDIRQKSGDSAMYIADLSKEIRSIARGAAASPTDVARGVDVLTTAGISADNARQMAESMAQASVAYRAAMEDLGQAGAASINNLNIPAERFTAVLNMMAQGSKLARFEVADMSREIPTLAALMDRLGYSGERAFADLVATLEIVSTSTGNAQEAANAVENIMSKLRSQETQKKFAKFGIDIVKSLEDGRKAGEDLFVTVAKISALAIKKGAIPEDLFQDMQVMRALTPLIEKAAQAEEFRQKIWAARDKNLIEEDWITRLNTFNGTLGDLKSSIENLAISLGNSLGPALIGTMEKIVPLIDKMREWIDANPELASGLILAAGGFLALSFALSAVKLAVAAMNVGKLTALTTLAGAKPSGTGWFAMAAGLAAVGFSLKTISDNMPAIRDLMQKWSGADLSGVDPNRLITEQLGEWSWDALYSKLTGSKEKGSVIDLASKAWTAIGERQTAARNKAAYLEYGQSRLEGQQHERLNQGLKMVPREQTPAEGKGDLEPQVKLEGVAQAKQEASQLNQDLMTLLGITVNPTIALTNIDRAIARVRELIGLMNSLNSTMAQQRGLHADNPGGGGGW